MGDYRTYGLSHVLRRITHLPSVDVSQRQGREVCPVLGEHREDLRR